MWIFFFADIKNNKKLIEQLMQQQAAASIRFLNDPRLNTPHYPINKQNYEHIIRFFLSRYDNDDNHLITSLNMIVQTIHQSKRIVQQLSYKLAQKKLYNRAIVGEVLKAWQHTHRYSYKRLFRILYSLETEYILQRMEMQAGHPSMQQLQSAINQAIQHYSHEVNTLKRATEQSNNPNTGLALY